MSDILLHREKGVNPHLTLCPKCGGDGPGLVIVGARDYIGICRLCGMRHIGKKSGKCGVEGCTGRVKFDRTLEDGERLPGDLCTACEEELEEHAAMVKDGGVYWKCCDCPASGVMKSGDFASAVREAHGIPAPAPCGVELTADQCPVCSVAG